MSTSPSSDHHPQAPATSALDSNIAQRRQRPEPVQETMASATGIPERNPAISGAGEDEPLLGRAGDASLPEGQGLQHNLLIGEESSITPVCWHVEDIDETDDVRQVRGSSHRPASGL